MRLLRKDKISGDGIKATIKKRKWFFLALLLLIVVGLAILFYINQARVDDDSLEGAQNPGNDISEFSNQINEAQANADNSQERKKNIQKIIDETTGDDQDVARASLIDECIAAKEVTCVEENIDKFNSPDTTLLAVYKDALGQLYIENGQTEKARELYQALLAEAEKNKDEASIDASPIEYYKSKLESL
jgi:hypothetical protein